MEPIAIIGLSGRFPGAADVAQFWDMLMTGREGIRRLGPDELDAAGVPQSLRTQPNFVAAEPVLDDIDLFDAEFFGLSPRDATALSPAIRLFLECAWEAFENAGVKPDGALTGVFASANLSQYWRLGSNAFDPSLEAILGNDKDYIASQVAYRLNLKGPAISVQTACSSSLVAVHMACQAIAGGSCEQALAGGAAVRVLHGQGYLHEPGSILSPDGHCRPFDVAPSGPVFGSGVGVVLLKSLRAALRDRDPIRAVIRGTAVNNDGSLKAGFAAPGLEGQASVIAQALGSAGLTADDISYIEAHGTGTALGDPVELAALARVFGPAAPGQEPIALGAVKGHVGHLETAAGITGLIKTVLALEAGIVPPTLHFQTPNPHLGLAATRFRIDARPQSWPRQAKPRRAGVSSFGMGGTNAHAVLEEAPAVEFCDQSERRPTLFLMSARSPAALTRIAQRLAAHVRAHPDIPLADIALTLATGRRTFDWRRAVVAHDAASLKEALLALSEEPPCQAAPDPTIGLDLSGQISTELADWLTSGGFAPDRLRLGHDAPDAVRALVTDTALPAVGVSWVMLPGLRADSPAPGRHQLLQLAGRSWSLGGSVDVKALCAEPMARRRPLPGYPFQRSRYWHATVEVPPAMSVALAPAVVEPAPAAPAPLPVDVPVAVREIVAQALLISVDRLEIHRSFIDLGADSLVLIEICQSLKRRFGVDVSVAQLFETLTNTGILAAYVAAQVSRPAPDIQSQPPKAVPVATVPARLPVTLFPIAPQPRTREPEPQLDARKTQHLHALIAAYQSRTAGSKRLSSNKRPILADTRSSAGFKMYLKEMLYSIVVDRGEGAHVTDVDGNTYVDVTMGFGCRMFGHNAAFMRTAMQAQLDRDAPLGPENADTGRVAELITRLTGAERIGIFSTGTEAVMTALRVARAKAGRDGIALFKGSYHGHSDLVLGMGLKDGQVAPLSAGIPADVVGKLTILDYGADEALARIEAGAGSFAAVLVEPVQSRFPDRQPGPFLHKLRALCDRLGIALIFDEMITGFRIGAGGAQRWFGVQADLVTYGKILGNGMPIGVIAGKTAWLDYLDGGAWGFGDNSAPDKPSIFYAGTFNKNPWSMAAAAATLTEIEARGPALYAALNMKTARLASRLNAYFAANGFPIEVVHFASLFRFRITSNADLFFLHLILRGIYVWEGRNCFLSDAHTDADIDAICRAAEEAAQALRAGGFFEPAPPRAAQLDLSRSQAQLLVAEATATHAAQAYTIPLVVEISGGSLDSAWLELALAQVVSRHEALRTVFGTADEPARILPHVWPDLTIKEGLTEAEASLKMAAVIDQGFAAGTPPLKALLCGLTDGRWLLMLALRHVVADGISLDILLSDLAAEYADLAEGQAGYRPSAPGFSAHLAWLDAQRSTPAWAGHLAFWQDRLRAPPQGISLPARSDLPADHAADCLRLLLPLDLSRALKRTAKAHGTTVFALTLAAAQAVLHRVSGDDDLIIGTPVTGRTDPASREVIGFCTHLLPLRSTHPGGMSFADYLTASRSALYAAMAHQDLPFAEILDCLNLPHDPSRPPLLSVTFNMDQPAPMPAMAAVSFRSIPPDQRYASYPLALNMTDLPEGFLLEGRFQTAVYDPAIVARLLDQYTAFLAAVAADPGIAVQAVPLDDHCKTTLSRLSAPMAVEDHGTCLQRIVAAAKAAPDSIAVIAPDRQTTYRDLLAEVESMARALVAEGLGKGDVLAICGPSSARFIAAVLAAERISAPFVLLDPAHGPDRHRAIIVESQAKAVLSLDREPKDIGPVLHWPQTPQAQKTRLPELAGSGDSACIFFTSGSTGTPKGLVGSYGAIAQFIDWQCKAFGVTGTDRVAQLTAVSFDAVLRDIFLPLCHGAAVLIPPEGLLQEPALVPGWLARERASIVHAVPSRVQSWLSAPAADLVALRWLFMSGEPLSPSLIQRWQSQFGSHAQLVNFYGSTETTMIRAFAPVDGRGATSVFSAIDGTELHVMKGDLPCAIGEAGEVVVRTPYRTLGALKGGVAATFVPNPHLADDWLYRSGDLGRALSDGRIEVLGRMDDQVKINGVRVVPAAVKSVLDQQTGVADSVVLTRTGADGTPQLYAWVISADPPASLVPRLRRELFARLGPAFVPRGIAVLTAAPLLPNGKVDRSALITPTENQRTPVPPRTETEAKVAAIWTEVLGLPVGADCDVFTLGANSLSATQALSRMRRDLFADLDLRHLFQLSTPALLAAHLEEDTEEWTETL